MSSTPSPCAACKLQRRKCTQECIFAPYFPPDQPQKFETVHKVFGASNVAKILSELTPAQREDAVNSLTYEAEARLRDPVYGCVGSISILQHRLKQVQTDLYNAKKELAAYIGPSSSAISPIFQHPNNPHLEAQQLATREQQEILRLSGALGLGCFDNGYHYQIQQQAQEQSHRHRQIQIQIQSQVLLQRQQSMPGGELDPNLGP